MNDLNHDKAIELLPWFVNGTVSATERDIVEGHVRRCLPCRAALREQQRLAGLVKAQPTVRLSAEQGFEQLLARMDQETPAAGPGEKRPQHERSPGRHPSGSRRRWPVATLARWYSGLTLPRGRAAVAAATLVLVIGAASWLTLTGTRDPLVQGFTTLAERSAGKEVRLDIVFADRVTEADMRALVRDVGGTIVGGPSDIGRYTIELASSDLGQRELDALISRLRNDQRVRFVGRTLIEDNAR